MIRTIPTDVQDFGCWFVPYFYLTVEVQYLRTDVAWRVTDRSGVACDEGYRYI